MREGETKLNFRFVSTKGDTIGIDDARFKNKVVIVQILGSWCPNCMDETAFLSEYYKANRQKGIEIIGLAYERSEDIEAAKKALLPFEKRLDVQYPFLITGVSVSDDKRTEKTLPQIDAIKAFPTTIFIRKDGKVDKIHTGFNGPGTGEYYEEFKKEFNEEISSLLNDR
jgi:thiol-disulfide isomerase/thioredoxin